MDPLNPCGTGACSGTFLAVSRWGAERVPPRGWQFLEGSWWRLDDIYRLNITLSLLSKSSRRLPVLQNRVPVREKSADLSVF